MTAAPSLMAGGCLEPDCHPNCGCRSYDFPAAGSVAWSEDSITLTLMDDTVSFSLSLAPVEVAIENNAGRLAWYDTVQVDPTAVESASVRLTGRGWKATFGATLLYGTGGAFVLPDTTPEGWLTITSVLVTTPGEDCPMYANGQSGTVPVRSDSLRIVKPPLVGLTVFEDTARFFTAAPGVTIKVGYPDARDPTVAPYAENGVTVTPVSGATSTIGELTTVLAGNELTVSGAEDLDITFATPVTAFGLWMVDGGEGLTGYSADSRFRLMFVDAAGDSVGPVTLDPPLEQAFFVGVTFDSAITGVAIREVGSAGYRDAWGENDFFGRVYTK